VPEHRVSPESREAGGLAPSRPQTVRIGEESAAGAEAPESPSWGQLLRTRRKPLAVYLGASTILSVATATGAGYFSPLAVGGILMGALLGVGLVLLARTRAQTGNAREPVVTLRRELDQTRRGYERLFTSVPCFICVLDRNHQILEANQLYREEFGVTDRSLCYEVCKKRTTQCPECIVDQTFADGHVHSSEEVLVTRDGKRINVVVHTRPVWEDYGTITAVMEVFTDITEVKRLQRQLALTGRAVAGMAHRVKNILMGLEGGIFIVNDGLETDDRGAVTEGWEMVERNVEKVSGIVKDLLYCSKEREPSFAANVCLHDIVLEVAELYASRMAGENIEILTELGEPPHRGTFDADGIHSLLCNLVANAIDACRFDPSENKRSHTVILRCRLNGDGSTVLEVEDDGAGIPEDLNSKVFQDFFSSKGTEGTGIGLLVVQTVAEEHRGNVTFESKPGEGTTFTVFIPGVQNDSLLKQATQA